MCVKNIIFGILVHVLVKMVTKHLENVFSNSVVICGKIIEVTKAVPTKIISRKTIPTEIILTNLNE